MHRANRNEKVTKDLRSVPKFSNALLRQHLRVEDDASRRKKLGYRLLKGSEAHFLVKACVSASMKKQIYIVYVHLNQNTGEVTHCYEKDAKGRKRSDGKSSGVTGGCPGAQRQGASRLGGPRQK
jgi:hypothetical protein